MIRKNMFVSILTLLFTLSMIKGLNSYGYKKFDKVEIYANHI